MDWLTPARRKAIYAALASVGSILTVVGVVTEGQVSTWLVVVDSVLAGVALVMASIKARRMDYAAVYAAASAILAALVGVNVLSEDAASMALKICSTVTATLPLVIAALRTDTSTPDGTPAIESAVAEPPLYIPEPMQIPLPYAPPPSPRQDVPPEALRTPPAPEFD